MAYNPEVLADASLKAAMQLSERFRLPLTRQKFTGVSGSWAGNNTGSSIDFHEHRQYFIGDDPRHIDWQAYARTSQYIMKVFKEEVSPVVDIMLDLSHSMFTIDKKGFLTQLLLNFCAVSAAECGASCHIWAMQGEKTRRLESIECSLGKFSFYPSNIGLTDSIDRVNLRPGSLRILISDLLFPGDPQHLISSLLRAKGRLMLYVPADSQEFAPEWNGDIDLVNIESGELTQAYIDQTTLSTYHEAYRRHFSLWHDCAIKNGVGMDVFYSHQPLAQQFEKNGLARFLVEENL